MLASWQTSYFTPSNPQSCHTIIPILYFMNSRQKGIHYLVSKSHIVTQQQVAVPTLVHLTSNICFSLTISVLTCSSFTMMIFSTLSPFQISLKLVVTYKTPMLHLHISIFTYTLFCLECSFRILPLTILQIRFKSHSVLLITAFHTEENVNN